MASPVDAGRQTTSISTAADPWTVSMPASIAAGDLLIAVGRASGGSTFNLPGGWSWLLQNNTSDATDDVTSVIYRTAAGSDTLSWDLSASDKGTVHVYRVTGHEAVGTQAPEIATATFTTAANAGDPPNIDPTGGSKDFLFIVHIGFDGETQTISAAPTNYSNLTTQNSGTGGAATSNCRTGSASRGVTATTENPGAFTHGAAGAGGLAVTIAVHPPGPAMVSGGVASESNTALGGSVIQPQVISGGISSESDSAPSGHAAQVYTAAPAAETDSAPSGTVIQSTVVLGEVAGSSESVPAGHVQQVYIAGTASEGDSAPAGQVAQVYTADPAIEADAVPAGSVDQGSGQTINGGVASENDAVPPGTVAQLYLAGVASEADTAPTGQVLQAILVAGGVASEADTAPTGSLLLSTILPRWDQRTDTHWPNSNILRWTSTPPPDNWPTDPEDPWP